MFRIFLMLAFIVACNPVKEKATVYRAEKGDVGQSGTNGSDGTSIIGTNGSSCTVANEFDADNLEIVGARISCTDGSFSIILNGLDGRDGVDGIGIDGSDGKPCSVSRESGNNFVTINCPDNSTVQLFDGENGSDGSTISILRPCSTVNHAEIFLKLSTGEIVAVYDGGPHDDRLTLLVPNVTYVTTDKDTKKDCRFKIDNNGNVIKL